MGEFRERLLDAQRTTPGLREEYRRELDNLLVHKLSGTSRFVNVALLAVWVIMAGACVWAAIVHGKSPRATADWWINLALYFTVFVVLAAGGIRNARKGQHTWRSYFHVAGMFYTAAGITVTLVLLRGLRTPHDPSSTFGAVFALTFLIVSLGWALQNRIDSSLLTMREHMLRLESRVADLAERMGK